MCVNSFLRKIVREVLVESIGDKRKYKNMKWELNIEQEYFLDYFITMNPDLLTKRDYIYAQSLTGIPVDSLKSIVLTHGSYNEREKVKSKFPNDFTRQGEIPRDSRFLIGKKPYTAKDFQLDLEREPFERKPKTVSKEYADSIRYVKHRDLPKNKIKDEYVMDRNHKSPPIPDSMIQVNYGGPKIKSTNVSLVDLIRQELNKNFFE